ncbi:hypothetical protein [Thiohalorhabdus methylotrophus]|uniref:O-antigen ligase-like membrane protein n=1 Tax=Thiohalorhabdus methylotrophus TaxID=3242694 RepID=A0ABV4TZ66_9GAMM
MKKNIFSLVVGGLLSVTVLLSFFSGIEAWNFFKLTDFPIVLCFIVFFVALLFGESLKSVWIVYLLFSYISVFIALWVPVLVSGNNVILSLYWGKMSEYFFLLLVGMWLGNFIDKDRLFLGSHKALFLSVFLWSFFYLIYKIFLGEWQNLGRLAYFGVDNGGQSLGIYIGLFFPILALTLAEKGKMFFSFVVILLCGTIVLASGSRAGVLAYILSFLYLVILVRGGFLKGTTWLAPLMVFGIFLFGEKIYKNISVSRKIFSDWTQQKSTTKRIDLIFDKGGDFLLEPLSPLFGIGMGGIRLMDSLFFHILFEVGILGLTLLGTIFGVFLYRFLLTNKVFREEGEADWKVGFSILLLFNVLIMSGISEALITDRLAIPVILWLGFYFGYFSNVLAFKGQRGSGPSELCQ